MRCPFKSQHIRLGPELRAQLELGVGRGGVVDGAAGPDWLQPGQRTVTSQGGRVRGGSQTVLWCKITCPFMEPAGWFHCGFGGGEAIRLLLLLLSPPPSPSSLSSKEASLSWLFPPHLDHVVALTCLSHSTTPTTVVSPSNEQLSASSTPRRSS